MTPEQQARIAAIRASLSRYLQVCPMAARDLAFLLALVEEMRDGR